ncbi:MAG: TldD/PmbA family protein [Candidatus Thermoplasmatota archaeon]|jgi:predicted Zn-dependent protease|nr:TldD/PmbA family protein [Candidatus Thermoplasmatota archaeon]
MPTQRSRTSGKGNDPIDRVLSSVTGAADVRHLRERWVTLRVANSTLYQPIFENREYLSLRVIVDGGRIGTATTTDLSTEGVAALAKRAEAGARNAVRTQGFTHLPRPDRVPIPTIRVRRDAAQGNFASKASELFAAIDRAGEELGKSRVAGVYNEGFQQLSVGNTEGIRRTSDRSVAQASLLLEDLSFDPAVSGWAEAASWDPRKVDLAKLGEEALSRVPREKVHRVPEGKYDVVLGAPAIAELLNMLSYGGLGAYSVEEGWSFQGGASRKAVISPKIQLIDDPLSPLGLPEAIDYEGVPARSRKVFDRGIATGPSHDTLTAGRAGGRTTANAVPPEAPYASFGPLPRHLSFLPGEGTFEELVGGIRKGLLVTRLHYVRFVHRKKTIVTGMTRDGTYWVENGEIQYPVANLRMTESILGILRRTDLTGKALRCCGDERGFFAPVVPDLRARKVAFSSATIF